jgi:hypothetical protein
LISAVAKPPPKSRKKLRHAAQSGLDCGLLFSVFELNQKTSAQSAKSARDIKLKIGS